MSRNGKIDCPDGNDDQEDIQWFENYEKHSKTKHLERLKNEDILKYIKDVEQNCRLEVNSGDEDYAGTKRSSNCSVKCSGTRFRSLKKIESRVRSKKNKNTALKRKTKRSSGRNATDTCNYCCSARKFHFRDGPDFNVQENSRRNLNTSTKSIYQHPKSDTSYKYREFSPTFHGWYSRKNYKTWPAVTKIASHEVIKDWYQNVTPDCNSGISRSKFMDRNSTKARTFTSLDRRKLGENSTYMDICSNIAPNEKTTERESHYRARRQRGETQMRKLNKESDVSDFVNQQPLNKIYSNRDMAFFYQASEQNGGYKGCYTLGYRYPVRRSRPTSWGLSSRSNRLTPSARLPETSSLLQRRTSQKENEIGRSLKASSPIIGTSIDRSYRETKRKNNMDQRRPNVLRERESSCYRRPGLLRESGKLCKVVRTRKDKQRLGCCCEDAERDEAADYSARYCRCPENTNDPIRLQRDSTCRPFTISKRANYTVATLRRTMPESVQPEDNNDGESESNLSMKEDPQNEDAGCDNRAFDVFDDVKTNNYDDAIDLEDLKPRVSFPNDRTRRGSSKVTWQYKKLSNDLKSNQGEAMGARTELRKKIIARYPASKEFSFAIRTPGKPVSGDSSRLRYDAVESTCDCKEPFHDPPAACLTGSCTCIGNDENAERNDSDSSRRISDTVCCCYCSCSSSTFHEEKDPVKKLESFCEKVKAVNQDMFRKPSESTCRNAARINAQEYARGSSCEQNQFSTQRAVRRARSTKGERLTDPARLRLEKLKHSHGGANLEKIFIYPPRGEDGPPLTLYKRSSNISCRVKGDADTGFRYSVTYIQKFVSPMWMPNLSPEVFSRETDEEYGCSADYG